MENILLSLKDPAFGDVFMIIGIVLVVFYIIRYFAVIPKVKQADEYLYRGAEAFEGMATGSFFMAAGCFMSEMLVFSIIAVIFTFFLTYSQHKFLWLRNSKSIVDGLQSMLDSKKNI